MLAEAGVQRCYGIVGDTLSYITDAMRRSEIEWVHMCREEAGAMAAGGEALITGLGVPSGFRLIDACDTLLLGADFA